MQARALITGGAGFVGSYLAEALLDAGWEVDVIDDLSTGDIENIAHLKENPSFRYTIDTVMNRPLMAELVDRADSVFHLAAAVGVRLIIEEPVRTIETNIKATEIVLELAAKKKKPVLVASTSEVYGKATGAQFAEDDDVVLGPTSKSRWCYAASKMIDEFLALAYSRERDLPSTVLRLFNTIGPRQTGQYGMVVPRFVKQALAGNPITVYGDGMQQRSFTWVGDVVDAMIKLIHHPGARGQVFNVGHTKEITILDLARLVKAATRSHSEIVLVPFEDAYAPGFEDMPRRMPDITKLNRLIGYHPTMDLPDMLTPIIEHCRGRIRPRIQHGKPALAVAR
jgi:nucleoside-diphosphate-sugar epimerase